MATAEPTQPRRAEDVAVGLHEASFSYPDGTAVLDRVSLAVERGTILGVVGPSGCGKSTLLSLIAELAAPSGGEVHRALDGSGRHPLSMVFQKDTLLPWLTAAENVSYFARFRSNGKRRRGLRPRGAGDAELDARVAELLELGHLADSAHKYPYQLSGGMRRRLAFLSAVAVNPQILLLDEPFSSVDEPTRIGIHQDVFRITRMMDMTTILVTHDLGEASTLCDRVAILSPRPTRVVHEHRVPFGEDRQMLELRDTPEFLRLYGTLWRDLSAQIAAQREEEAP